MVAAVKSSLINNVFGKKTNPGAADRCVEEADADPTCVPSHAVDIPRNTVRCDQYGCSLSHPGSRSAPVRGASPSEARPLPLTCLRLQDAHVHGDVNVHGASTSTGRPRPRGVYVRGAPASTGRLCPRDVHVRGRDGRRLEQTRAKSTKLHGRSLRPWVSLRLVAPRSRSGSVAQVLRAAAAASRARGESTALHLGLGR